MINTLYDTFHIGKLTITLEFLSDESAYAVAIKYKNEEDREYYTFDCKRAANKMFDRIKNGSNPWIEFGIINNIPLDWKDI